jgi:hypothetical protein
MAGLLEKTVTKDDYKNVVGYDPEKIKVEKDSTVQGQIGGIIDKNSPLMQRAATRADQSSNRRGLLNSSMAVQAGESALYDAALPIAQQDAATNFRSQELNQGAGNEAYRFNAGSGNQKIAQERAGEQALEQIGAQTEANKALQKLRGEQELGNIAATGAQQRQNIGAQSQAESTLMEQKKQIDLALQTADAATREKLLNRQGEIDLELTTKRHLNEMEMQGMRGGQAKELAELENQYAMLRQVSQSAGGMYATHMQEIGTILSNKDIPLEQKTNLVNIQLESLRNGLALIGNIGNIDLTGILTTPGQTPGQTPSPPPRPPRVPKEDPPRPDPYWEGPATR